MLFGCVYYHCFWEERIIQENNLMVKWHNKHLQNKWSGALRLPVSWGWLRTIWSHWPCHIEQYMCLQKLLCSSQCCLSAADLTCSPLWVKHSLGLWSLAAAVGSWHWSDSQRTAHRLLIDDSLPAAFTSLNHHAVLCFIVNSTLSHLSICALIFNHSCLSRCCFLT